MSNGQRVPGTIRYSGTLYRTTGPAFDARPWTAVTNVPVGTMSVEFTDGNSGTLTYTVNGVARREADRAAGVREPGDRMRERG